MVDAIIVGGGIFGQVIARALRSQGQTLLVFDRVQPNSGSKPAACLMKPGWYSGMGKEVHEPAMKLLDDLYGVEDVEFVVGASPLKTKVHWINPQKILNGQMVVKEDVLEVGPGFVRTSFDEYRAKTVVVAAGVWTEKLLPAYKQKAQGGAAFLWEHGRCEPKIRPWAPYKQMVRFNRGDGLWVGDGSSILSKNWTLDRQHQSLQRSKDFSGMSTPPSKTLYGLRPYSKDHKPCLLEDLGNGLWVASGGAKNGTVAAGYCAHTIMKATT